MAYAGGPMTEAMYYVLLALMNPNHGYQLMNEIAEVSKGRVRMGPGTLYGVLARMQKEGLISLSEDDGRREDLQDYNRWRTGSPGRIQSFEGFDKGWNDLERR